MRPFTSRRRQVPVCKRLKRIFHWHLSLRGHRARESRCETLLKALVRLCLSTEGESTHRQRVAPTDLAAPSLLQTVHTAGRGSRTHICGLMGCRRESGVAIGVDIYHLLLKDRGPCARALARDFLTFTTRPRRSTIELQRCQHLIAPPGTPFDVYVTLQGKIKNCCNLRRGVASPQQRRGKRRLHCSLHHPHRL